MAERLLLRSALREPRNQRFVLLDGATVPLYPPGVWWQQLLMEQRSRINACEGVRPRTCCVGPFPW